MGMYTELSFAADIDEHAYTTLQALMNGQWIGDEHAFFDDPHRARAIVSAGGSYYFPRGTHVELVRDDISGPAFSVRTNLKNYESTIEAFLDWIKPHVVMGAGSSGYVGHVLYEEAAEPTLIYVGDREAADR